VVLVVGLGMVAGSVRHDFLLSKCVPRRKPASGLDQQRSPQ
jgi:hypothetical protein